MTDAQYSSGCASAFGRGGVTRLAHAARRSSGDIGYEMTVITAPTRIVDEWIEAPVVPDAEEEFRRARLAWLQVGPADGSLPADRSPLQCLVFARLTTSLFLYEMAIRRQERKRGL
jgi:hypothetical protein